MRIEYEGSTYVLTMTCGACPEQYDVTIDGEQVGYLRLRHGTFAVRSPDHEGEEILEGYPEGDGVFEDDERQRYLDEAIEAIHAWRGRQ